MKSKHYDVFVIGSGIAGQTVAKLCSENGLSVAISDNRAFGGTCANRGCDPKKILLQFSDLAHKSNQLTGLGIKKAPKISWKDVQSFKKKFTKKIPKGTENSLSDLGISMYHQSPKFIANNKVEVEGKHVTADYFVIATGKIPRPLNIEGHKFLKVSDDVLNLKKVPKSAIFIGAGYIGLEFAYMLSVLGCKVTILQKDSEALSQFDSFLVEKLVKSLKTKGVEFIFNVDVKSIEKLKKNFKVNYDSEGTLKSIKSRQVFNTSGRIPAIEELDLSLASIEANDTGVEVDFYLQSTTNPLVYACGDVSSKSLPLTPLSGLQGYIVAHNIIKEKSKKFENPLVPSNVFTQPNLASVGYSESEAKKRYKNIKIYQGDVSHWFNAKKSNEDAYAYKILVNERTDEIVGAHILSPEANETINILTLAINNKITVSALKKHIFTYPSYTNDLKTMLKD
ncbi:dihydrolipoyl dehydrogenase family protein [Algibacter miyuki]|uniref:Dihydrolipoyl dehydrogenase family protein n=1 Tax=Algibacter miyuki TaxID=1306933 RepID=A0ABV5GW11_9FLAO|nr:NAD(P)/FAD-dependent oxidoreductase [Algibacter miyuki]MDN3665004.1 NAD(P)/FAD-dependent oxidoreductase [Algibacter miyuki]